MTARARIPASIPTREAGAVLEAATEAWRDHRRGCPQCERAARSRRPREMCARGRVLNRNRAEAQATHKREKAADARPNPDQGELISLAEARINRV